MARRIYLRPLLTLYLYEAELYKHCLLSKVRRVHDMCLFFAGLS